MMAEIQWSLGQTDPIGEQARAYSYADKIHQSAAQYQAGNQYAKGDLSGAGQTMAKAGNIQGAQQLEKQSQGQAEAAYEYIGKALPVLKAVADKHAGDPDGGTGALAQAFDQLAPELEQVTGHNTQVIGQFRQGLVSDPKGTLARVEGMLPTKYITSGRTVLAQQGNNIAPVYEGKREAPAGYEYGPDGKTLQPMLGGPSDPKVVHALGQDRREIVVNNPIPSQGGGSGTGLKQEIQLRKEFDQLPDVKDFHDVANSYDVISDIAKKPPTAQNDLSLIFAYMKMLDPGSVVREGEFANAQNTAGVPDQIRNLYNKAATGQRLNPDQRKEFTNTAGGIYTSRKRRYDQIVTQYKGYAKDSGMGDNVIQARIAAGGGEAPAPNDAKNAALLKKYGL